MKKRRERREEEEVKEKEERYTLLNLLQHAIASQGMFCCGIGLGIVLWNCAVTLQMNILSTY